MKNASLLVAVVLLLGLSAGVGSIVVTRRMYGPSQAPATPLPQLAIARDLDEKGHERLEELSVRFHEAVHPGESKVDLADPTDADYAFLFDVLANGKPDAKLKAAAVLRDIGTPRVVEPLIAQISGLEDSDRFFLAAALGVVNGLPQDERLAALIPAWEKHQGALPAEIRDALRIKLRDIGAMDAEWQERAAVADADPLVRRFALREIAGRTDPPRGVLALALADPDAEIRGMAEAALAAHRK